MATVVASCGLALEDVRRFTPEEFSRMVETGVLDEDERVELLEGFLVPMTPIGDEHAACVIRASNLLYERLAGRVWVSVQNAIAIAKALPQPDIVILRRQPDCYRSGKPQPADVYLVIEVADSSLRRDRDVKLPLYGRAGIRETWVVDLAGEVVIVGREPGATGYGAVTLHRRGDRLVVPGFQDITLTVDEILGPPAERTGG